MYYLKRVENNGKEKTSALLKTAKKNPDISELFGTWVIDNEIHPFKEFTLSESQLTTVNKDIDTHHLVMENNNCCSSTNTNIVGTFLLKKADTVHRYPNNKPWYDKYIGEELYRLILHDNGLVKFKPVAKSKLYELVLARVDSQSNWNFLLNVVHASRFGCFCFCILTEDGKLRRLNRWYGAVKPFYIAERK